MKRTSNFMLPSTVSVSFSFSPDLEAATGPFDFPMTNDYMFRAVLQTDNKALTGFISALLQIPISEISAVEVTNPIILGNECTDKEFRLDINLVLNRQRIINLEMQVLSHADWTSRSLAYLCRNFVQLSRGMDYASLLPVIHIGILDHSLFPDAPEFYSRFMLMNIKTHRIYSDKIALNMLDLTHTELSSQDDREWKLDYWAKLFKATTWEDLKMIAKNDECLTAASNTIFTMNTDDRIRKRCLDREDYYRDIHNLEKQIAENQKIIAEKDAALAQLRAELEKLKAK